MVLQVGRELVNPCAEPYTVDMPLDHIDLEPFVSGVFRCGSEDTVKIPLLDVVRIHKHELADSKADELLNNGAPGSGTPHHCYAKTPQEGCRTGSEQLSMTFGERRDLRLWLI